MIVSPTQFGALWAVHVLAAVLMAAPLYMLILINERAALGRAVDTDTDRFVENIIRRQPIRCYAFLAVILVSGLWLLGLIPGGRELLRHPVIVAKLVLFFVLVTLLTYLHNVLQPQVEALLARVAREPEAAGEVEAPLWALRRRRKVLVAVSLFLVLTMVILGVALALSFSNTLLAVMIALAALFAWRAYRSTVPFGWF